MAMNIDELEKRYNLELPKLVDIIKKKMPCSVLLQFPEGLKPYATSIIDYLESETDIKDYRIYMGSCFGACDVPNIDTDLIIQFGHAPWNKKEFNELKD